MVLLNNIHYAVYASLAIVVIIAASVLCTLNPNYFLQYTDPINPLVAIISCAILGYFILDHFNNQEYFKIYRDLNLLSAFRYASIVFLFVFVAILIDLIEPLPANINVPFPDALMFYPPIAFVVEILFHLVPLAILISLFKTIFKTTKFNQLFWLAILITSTLEPTYQALQMGPYPDWVLVIVWVNLFFFNVTQLLIFKRFDFMAMYAFRILYYFIWHIIWGYYRLELIFEII
mgnify:CR=1 FL=1